MHGAGRPLAGDLQTRDLIADFERQLKMGACLARALRDSEGRFAEGLAAAGERLDHARARALSPAQYARGKLAPVSRGLIERKRCVVPVRAQGEDAAGAAGELGEAFDKSRTLAIVEPVGKPHHAIIRLAAKLALERRGKRLAIRRVGLRREPRRAFTGLLSGDGTGQRISGCGGREHDGPAVTSGAIDSGIDGLAPLRPMRRGRPAIVDDEQERSGAGKALPVGVEHGSRQRQHDQSGEQHAQGGQPPRAMGRSLLGGFEILQQPRRREHHVVRAWRRQPQQPPDRRQRCEAEENPRLQEADGAEGHHRRRLSSASPATTADGGR